MTGANSRLVGLGRASCALSLALASCAIIPSAHAQTRIPIDLGTDEPPPSGNRQIAIDILPQQVESEPYDPAKLKQCAEERDAATISQEIIVCGSLRQDSSQWASGSREAWLRDYARRTAFAGDPRAPGFSGGGGGSGDRVAAFCLFGRCAPPPAIFVDVEALPPPPKDSDADRIAKGLPPMGDEGELTPEARKLLQDELGLPPVPKFANGAWAKTPTTETDEGER
ncbi:MAG: hypothetical protein AAF687_07660 [Pseudomonadota bacterium]